MVEQRAVTEFLERVMPQRAPHELVFREGARALVAAFGEVLRVLGLPRGDLVGLTLASLRAGGATWMFEVSGDLELVRWRGRWSSSRSLEVYIQEVASDRLLADVAPSVRERVRRLSAAAPGLLLNWGA